jgi:uncharacterized protein YdeI (YjbR/CyaY-like superfamily)
MKPAFFATQNEFRSWLKTNHDQADELWIRFYKKASGKPGMTIRQAVDQALCFGWIDGILKSTGKDSFTVRFTPRRKSSLWSEVNTRRAGELIKLGLMQAAGLKAFEERDKAKTRFYSYESRSRGLSPELEKVFQQRREAWEFFAAQPPSYQETISFWVTSAKREET